MKILALHCDYIKFKPLKKALRSIEPLSEKEKQGGNVKEALVILTAVEKGDSDIKQVSEKLVKNIQEIAQQVNAKNIVLYPYAHLSSQLAAPDIAVKVLEEAEKILQKSKGINVVRAPFGYYKEFELKVKGHPLSELSREIKIEGEVKEEYDAKKLLKEISKTKLDASKLKENDHRIIGQQMNLFSFSETAPGMVFWHHNGLVIKNELIKFWREVHQSAGYKEILTPQILDQKLWQISGHWEKYKENIFLTDYEKRKFAVKPMNCPGGMLIYKTKPKSYKDLPLKVGELGIVHRQELSGVLGGLFRLIQFTQDDAHIFCNEKQLEQEIAKVMDLVEILYSKFGFEYKIELSTRPEKQCGTIQVDFAMPERFELEYVDKDNKKKRPIMVHRAIYGSFERFIGILIEHFKGRLPVWLAPVQIRVLSFTDRNIDYAKTIVKQFEKELPDLRIDSDFRQTTIPSKVKDGEIMRVPYIIVIGDKEEKEKTLAVRIKGNKKIENFSVEEFIAKLKKEIDERK
jgi:threonyl-tRNA synthetase